MRCLNYHEVETSVTTFLFGEPRPGNHDQRRARNVHHLESVDEIGLRNAPGNGGYVDWRNDQRQPANLGRCGGLMMIVSFEEPHKGHKKPGKWIVEFWLVARSDNTIRPRLSIKAGALCSSTRHVAVVFDNGAGEPGPYFVDNVDDLRRRAAVKAGIRTGLCDTAFKANADGRGILTLAVRPDLEPARLGQVGRPCG